MFHSIKSQLQVLQTIVFPKDQSTQREGEEMLTANDFQLLLTSKIKNLETECIHLRNNYHNSVENEVKLLCALNKNHLYLDCLSRMRMQSR